MKSCVKFKTYLNKKLSFERSYRYSCVELIDFSNGNWISQSKSLGFKRSIKLTTTIIEIFSKVEFRKVS